MKKSLFIFSLVFLLCIPFGCQKQAEKAEPAVDSKVKVEAAIQFLADDLLEGRGTPSRGLDIAALYLANELKAAGWEPANSDSYFQTYDLGCFDPHKSRYKIAINGIELDPEEFVFDPFGMDPTRTPMTYDLVFAGHGIFSPEKNMDDFSEVDLDGKAVISLLGAPWKTDPMVVHSYDRVVGKMVHVTVRNGAFLVYVSKDVEAPVDSPPSAEMAILRDYSQILQVYIPEFEGKPTCGLCPVLAITPAAFDRTLSKIAGGTYEDWQDRLSTQEYKASDIEAAMEISIEVQPEENKASNVVAMLQGNDPSLKDEWIVLTAHYDHLGSHEVPPGQDGIWNGADDNASGTAAVLEIARRLAKGKPPQRSILVVFTSGEELGLLGSAYYAKHPLVPEDRVIVNINVDMVGRSDGTVQAITTGCDELFSLAASIGQENEITVLEDKHPMWRLVYLIDSYHFARFDIPFVQFMTEFHQDYHQPSDEVSKIRFEELGRILEVMLELTDYYAQGGQKSIFQRPEWFLTAKD